MFFDQSESGDDFGVSRRLDSRIRLAGGGDSVELAPEDAVCEKGLEQDTDVESVGISSRRGAYERELIESVWEFAEVVPGNDPALWRKDEFGDWIHRLDYGRRSSEFGWEIFDPGIGRHAQGVYAMRPMQWESYIRQYEAFA